MIMEMLEQMVMAFQPWEDAPRWWETTLLFFEYKAIFILLLSFIESNICIT